MNKVYNYLNSLNYYPEGVVEILGTTYKFTRVTNIRTSQIPEIRGWNNIYFGVWIIRPEKSVIIRVELV